MSRLRRLYARLFSDPDGMDVQRASRETEAAGGTPCAELPDRARVTAGGTVRNVTVRPRAGVPALEVELNDGSGTVTVVFLGRRRVAGVEPGREMVVHGLVCELDGRATMYNPRYELRPVGAG